MIAPMQSYQLTRRPEWNTVCTDKKFKLRCHDMRQRRCCPYHPTPRTCVCVSFVPGHTKETSTARPLFVYLSRNHTVYTSTSVLHSRLRLVHWPEWSVQLTWAAVILRGHARASACYAGANDRACLSIVAATLRAGRWLVRAASSFRVVALSHCADWRLALRVLPGYPLTPHPTPSPWLYSPTKNAHKN